MSRSTGQPMLSRELVEFVHGGVAVMVATRDDDLRPVLARGWGPHVSEDGQSASVCVAAPEGSRMRANLASNGSIAITLSPPTIARGVQLKGAVNTLRAPDAGELQRALEQLEAFNAGAEAVGVGPGLARRLFVEPGLALTSFSIDEVFDQTPGPNAGQRL